MLADAEAALTGLVADKGALEARLAAAQEAEQAAVRASEALRAKVSSLQSQLEAALEAAVSLAPPDTEASAGGTSGPVQEVGEGPTASALCRATGNTLFQVSLPCHLWGEACLTRTEDTCRVLGPVV